MNEDFKTYDLGLAAALVTKGYKLLKLNRDNPRKVEFIFEDDALLSEVVNEYWDDKLLISPRKLFDNMKMLKNRIYSK